MSKSLCRRLLHARAAGGSHLRTLSSHGCAKRSGLPQHARQAQRSRRPATSPAEALRKGSKLAFNAPLRRRRAASGFSPPTLPSSVQYERDTDTRGVACLCSLCHGQQQSRRLLDGTRGCALPPVQVRPRQVRHQPGLAEEYGTHDEAPSKLCTRTLPNAWRTPLPSLARSQWT